MLWSLDSETTGVDLFHGCLPFMFTACSEDGDERVWFAEVDPHTRIPLWDPAVKRDLRRFILNNHLIFQNVKFDVRAADRIGVIDGYNYLRKYPWEDTILMHHVLNNQGPHGLKAMALKYADIPDEDEEELHKAIRSARHHAKKMGWRIADKDNKHFPGHKQPSSGWKVFDYWLPRAVAQAMGYPHDHPWHTLCYDYARTDAIRTTALYHIFKQGIADLPRGTELYKSRKRLAPVVYAMEERGAHIHIPRLKQEVKRLKDVIGKAERSLSSRAVSRDVNINSPKQLTALLYEKFGLPIIERTEKGNPTTGTDTLVELYPKAGPRIRRTLKSIITIRKTNATLGFLDQYRSHSMKRRIHSSYNITGTPVVRISSGSPNLQNMKKGEDPDLEPIVGNLDLKPRRIFGPSRGRHWFAIDYKQLQIFIFAYASQERELINALHDGWDAHSYVAHRIFKVDKPSSFQRRVAKTVNFGFIFGAKPAKIEKSAGIPGLWGTVNRIFPNAGAYIETLKAQIRNRGYVETLDGYPLYVPRRRSYAGANYVIQGSEARTVQRAMCLCHDYLEKRDDGSFLTLQIHDELVFDCPDKSVARTRKLAELMVKAGRPHCDLKVDVSYIADNLAEGEDWNAKIVRATRRRARRDKHPV